MQRLKVCKAPILAKRRARLRKVQDRLVCLDRRSAQLRGCERGDNLGRWVSRSEEDGVQGRAAWTKQTSKAPTASNVMHVLIIILRVILYPKVERFFVKPALSPGELCPKPSSASPCSFFFLAMAIAVGEDALSRPTKPSLSSLVLWSSTLTTDPQNPQVRP